MNVIMEHAAQLQAAGHEVCFIAETLPSPENYVRFPILNKCHTFNYRTARKECFDVLSVTFWPLIYPALNWQWKSIFQLIQGIDYQSIQSPCLRRMAQAVLALDLPGVTVSEFISNTLKNDCARNPDKLVIVRNGIDKKIFHPQPASRPDITECFRVLVEGPVDVPFKNVEAALRIARNGGADEVWLLTSSDITSHPLADRVFVQIPHEQTADIYRACHLLVKTSRFEGMCLPPLEMFHCNGCAVLYELPSLREYAADMVNSLLVAQDDEDTAAAAVQRIKNDPDLYAALTAGALHTAQTWPDQTTSGKLFIRYIEQLPPADCDLIKKTIRQLVKKHFPALLLWRLRRWARRTLNLFKQILCQ